MKKLIFCLLLYSCSSKIIKTTTDDRNLTSVIYKHKGKKYALDYLTKQQFDSLKYNRHVFLCNH